MDWVSAFLNRRSREHRYVSYVLQREKAKLKETKGDSLNDITRRLSQLQNITKNERGLMIVQSESDIKRLEEAVINSWQKRNALARLINAIGYCIAAHTDIVCYLLTIVCHAINAGLITLPLPFMVFFWGTLSNPRPSKFFWVSMILYTEIIVVVKFVCQFGFWPFNDPTYDTKEQNEPLAYPYLLGIQKKPYYPTYEVALLMALFFHRYMLRRLGLWKNANVSETFDGDAPRSGEGIENFAMDAGSTEATTEESPGTSWNEAGIVVTTAVEVEEKEKEKRRGLSRFIYQLFYPKFRYIRDLYPAMFTLDFLCFLIIVFGYSSFGEGGSGNVIGDIKSNRVPLPFVVMMIVVSFMIVIDRGLYLRKAVRCKLAYQILIIVFMHIWIFIFLPLITNKKAATNGWAQFLYIVKCIYLLFSAWQIRNGYPNLCVGNLLMSAYGLVNMIFYKIFMLVPFVWELRTAIDWTWTDTSMPLFDFFNMEMFYSTIYVTKCNRKFEADYPAPRGEKKGALVKYLMGLPFVIFIVLLIWLPLLAFSLLNKVGQVVPLDRVSLTVSIEGYPVIYSVEAQGSEIHPFTNDDFKWLNNNYSDWYKNAPDFVRGSDTADANDKLIGEGRNAVGFIGDYSDADVQVLRFRPESQSSWLISNASKTALLNELDNKSEAKMIVSMSATREKPSEEGKEASHHSTTFSIKLEDATKKRLVQAINGDQNMNVFVNGLVPKFIIIPNEGSIEPANLLLIPAISVADTDTTHAFSGLNFRYQSNDFLWTMQMRVNNTTNAIDILAPKPVQIPYQSPYANDLNYVEVIAFVDRVFPSVINRWVSGGIIAMYIALVILISKTIRGVMFGTPLNVILTEIPNPDYILKICLDIYLVREAKDFVLEQDLFAKLIFLFRSPETLIKWTRIRPKAKRD